MGAGGGVGKPLHRAVGQGAFKQAQVDAPQPQTEPVVHAQLNAHLPVGAVHPVTVAQHVCHPHLRVADALRVLDVAVNGLVDGGEPLRRLQIPGVEQLILGENDIFKPDLRHPDQVAAVELVPQHAVVKGGGVAGELPQVIHLAASLSMHFFG